MAKGLARQGFDIDLALGQATETRLNEILKTCKLEVKSDHQCADTGNVFIEFRQKGRPSGIAVTEAEFWAIEYLPDRILLIRTDELKAIARRWFYKRRVKGGDFNRYDGVLIPMSEFLPKAKR